MYKVMKIQSERKWKGRYITKDIEIKIGIGIGIEIFQDLIFSRSSEGPRL